MDVHRRRGVIMAIAAGPAANTKQSVGGETKTWDGTKWVPEVPLTVVLDKTAPPATQHKKGDIRVDPDNHLLYYHDGTAWQHVNTYFPVSPTDYTWPPNPHAGIEYNGQSGLAWSDYNKQSYEEIHVRKDNTWQWSKPHHMPHGLVTGGTKDEGSNFTNDIHSAYYERDARVAHARRYLISASVTVYWKGGAEYMNLRIKWRGTSYGYSRFWWSAFGQVATVGTKVVFSNMPYGTGKLRMEIERTTGAFQTGNMHFSCYDIGGF